MTWVESLQKAINYMEEHLLDEISIDSIAKQANFSAFHFQRTFSILTDISVGEYLRRRRLTLAAHELNRENTKIIDIAYKYGYDTPEAFSKAFRRQHGITPSEARKYAGRLKSYNRLVIQVSVKGAEPMQYKIVEREAFQIVGIKREFSCINQQNQIDIPKMWDKVNGDGTDDLLFRLNDGLIEGVLGVCVDKSSEVIDYWIGTTYEGDVPDGLVALTIPESKWAVFEVHGPMPDAMPKVWKQIFSEWFPSSGYKHAGIPELEVYSEEDPSSPDLYSEIWIPVK
ncbi:MULTISPECIES: AraC family transcriptional regulator [Virgibacillus]|uniref:AraC family transcriptional regulator n=1 Tax=Virgibacillus salarius TaxID=447199 RepID=A0A941IBF1_9BACI|nr:MULTISPECIES: AraC family transcriptional regulator [Bacillaceae]MBR7796337.1 AraC family transcriptional regulator [Virgibacillus salarius]MDY7044818.1 AraC family transcriptional regulator [Virgibacillus sp. M23]NAZ09046.1 helix-turn-helix domain-containing protein [Agaribacter marinus]WBX80254.1 AraC family transcriptional regulator [Virgibacillus salarius]